MTDRFQEARRLLAAGFKLCVLHPMSKQPYGDDWNHRLLTHPDQVSTSMGGFGVPLATNGLCSIDFDNTLVAEVGLMFCGFDPQAIRAAGIATSSTRPGSGGRVAFRVPPGSSLKWIRFTNRTDGTILELRASSANLQDCLPGTTYLSANGDGPWAQDYAGPFTLDLAPELPSDLLAWWQRMSDDIVFRHEQQRLIAGTEAQLDVSNGKELAFGSAYRVGFNQTHSVEEILLENGYTEKGGRFAPPTATGGHGVRRIPGRDELWQSDHASDPLFGTFDAWTANVVLTHRGNLAAAESAAEQSRALVAVDGFEDVEVPVVRVEGTDGPVEMPEPEMPSFERDKNGRIKATINNLLAVLRRPDIIGLDIAQDQFRDEIMVAKIGSNSWRKFGDADYTMLRSQLEGWPLRFLPIGRELIRDAVLAVADERKFDSAIAWLDSLVWDGVPRIDTFFPRFFGAADTEYHRATSTYTWTAMAGRVLSPGCQADMVPILVGAQGLRKTTGVKALVPAPDFFTEVSFAENSDNLARKMRGKLVAEFGELQGLHTKEMEAIKAFITRTHENWIPKFREFETTFPRRLIFIGTTNKDQFLADDTGNRRWLPIRVGQVDVGQVQAVAAQCWAEAAVRFRQSGVAWQDAQRLAAEVHDDFAFQDDWVEKVRNWLSAPLFDGEERSHHILTSEVLQSALGYDLKQIRRADEMRMGSVLRKLGYERKKVRVEGVPSWRFVPTSTLLCPPKAEGWEPLSH